MPRRLDIDALNQVQLCAGHTLRRTTRAVSQHFDEKLRPSGLRVSQFAILGTLGLVEEISPEPMTMTDLAGQLLVDRTTLARNLRPLERDGLVHVAPGEDRRTRRVRLTDQGHARLAEAFHQWQEAQAEIVDALGADRWEHLRGELHELTVLVQ